MVDLEKVKREVTDVCRSIENAFIALCDRSKEYAELDNQIDARKAELLLLDNRKMNAAESVRAEERIAIEGKKKYTNIKVKNRKLIEKETLALAKVLGEHKAEIDAMRMREMSSLKAEQSKIKSEIEIFTQERDEVKREYNEVKNLLTKLKKGIPD